MEIGNRAKEKWAKINYRDFYDVPRIFFWEWKNQWILFESVFLEDQDEYDPIYSIYLMKKLSKEDCDGSWKYISDKAIKKLGEIPVNQVKFDPTLRKEIEISALEEILTNMTLE